MSPPPPAEQFAARIFMGPALRAQPDRRLVDLVRDGYDAAFEEIVRRYKRSLDRFAAAIVGGRSEDVTQDAFSKALLALRGSEAEIELRPWLYRIVRNTALNDLRDRAPTGELPETLPGGRSAAAEAEAREELADLMKRLRALPENYRAAIVMRELEGLGHEEIAAALGLSGGAARQVLYRARTTLREGLGLVVPLPLVRVLTEHADDAGRAGGAIAAGAGSSAGGAALGGLGGGALKAGVATILIAGAVGAGVAVEHHKHDGAGPEAAEAAPLTHGKHRDSGASANASGTKTASESAGKRGHDSENRGPSDRSGRGDHNSGSLSDGSGSGHSDSGPKNSGSGSGGPSNQGPNPGSGGGDDKSGTSGKDGGGSGGSGSDDGSSGGSSSSGGGSSSGSDGGQSSGSDDGAGSGSGDGGGEITEPITTPELVESSDGGSDSGSITESSGETSGGSGSGDLSGSDSSGSDGSP